MTADQRGHLLRQPQQRRRVARWSTHPRRVRSPDEQRADRRGQSPATSVRPRTRTTAATRRFVGRYVANTASSPIFQYRRERGRAHRGALGHRPAGGPVGDHARSAGRPRSRLPTPRWSTPCASRTSTTSSCWADEDGRHLSMERGFRSTGAAERGMALITVLLLMALLALSATANRSVGSQTLSRRSDWARPSGRRRPESTTSCSAPRHQHFLSSTSATRRQPGVAQSGAAATRSPSSATQRTRRSSRSTGRSRSLRPGGSGRPGTAVNAAAAHVPRLSITRTTRRSTRRCTPARCSRATRRTPAQAVRAARRTPIRRAGAGCTEITITAGAVNQFHSNDCSWCTANHNNGNVDELEQVDPAPISNQQRLLEEHPVRQPRDPVYLPTLRCPR